VSGEAVKVTVGSSPKQETFYIPKSVLQSSSAFLRAALKPEWAGDTCRPIDLTDENPTAFGIYAQWLYSGRFLFKLKGAADLSDNWITLAQTYVLGEKLMDTTFQNEVIDAVFAYRTQAGVCIPTYRTIKIAYEGTCAGSPMRKYLVDTYVWSVHISWTFKNIVEDTSVEFLQEVLEALVKIRPTNKRGEQAPWTKAAELYYTKDTK
ncbi:hypothetical protein P280DRAFT_398397, partial [Massarina eburnea CBS 473.64]